MQSPLLRFLRIDHAALLRFLKNRSLGPSWDLRAVWLETFGNFQALLGLRCFVRTSWLFQVCFDADQYVLTAGASMSVNHGEACFVMRLLAHKIE